ncbi:hypothetical protein RIF29_38358 [Crotalaria pallida]|uniref:Uncharacterized protein n=1 Tax=Crotalaria pallida TaxID=3830 RepID=A0AAN9HNV5_CROPI
MRSRPGKDVTRLTLPLLGPSRRRHSCPPSSRVSSFQSRTATLVLSGSRFRTAPSINEARDLRLTAAMLRAVAKLRRQSLNREPGPLALS